MESPESPSAGQTRPSWNQFQIFRAGGKPVLAMAMGERRLRMAAVRRFPVYSAKRRLFRRMMQLALKLHLDGPFSERGALPSSFIGDLDFTGLLQRLCDDLGRHDLFPVVHGPPQTERRRLYVHLLDQRGQPVAFAKLALDQQNNARLAREVEMLTMFRATPPVRFQVPRLTREGMYDEHRYLLLEPLPQDMTSPDLTWEALRMSIQEMAGPLRLLSAPEVREAAWYQELQSRPDIITPQYLSELNRCCADGLPVCRVHGDFGINNLVLTPEGLWIIDWEQSSDNGPFRTDEIAYYLSLHHSQLMSGASRAAGAFAQTFLAGASPQDRRDVQAALAFLSVADLETARRIIAQWDAMGLPKERLAALGARPHVAAGEAVCQIAIISNEPTPYRVHVLTRIARELRGIHVHNIFTHTISNPSMPWEMQIGAEVNPVFFPRHHLRAEFPISRRSLPLFFKIRRYLRNHTVQMIVLLGYNDLTRMLLIAWARHQRIPLLLAGDSNIFAEGRVPPWLRVLKRRYVRWVLNHINGLMPMGTCGRAFFRLYKDHNLPEFLFPYEPNYAGLRHVEEEKLAAFCQKYGLAPDRKRLLFSGRLVDVKRVDVLLKAFVRVAAGRPQWDLVIAGGGTLRKELEQLVPASLHERVKWLGFIQFNEVVCAYHACHVLVHPSEYEPWGLVINEAVTCDLPVISTSVVGAAVELVRHQANGLLIPPRSVEAMADAIWQVTTGERYLEMRQHCAGMLQSWREGADPVDGVVQAMRYFGLVWPQITPSVQPAEETASVAPATVP
ncbi:MAG: glycosyltransferase [Tepidisphaeraceae bacterium]|jgi:glycosyltransferase involved in cell wall biosynthesis